MQRIKSSSLRVAKNGSSVSAEQAIPGPIQIACGPMLCRLHVWTEEEWKELPEAERPLQFTHAPGLGWVGALPIDCMN
jgi:hypothetical protein